MFRRSIMDTFKKVETEYGVVKGVMKTTVLGVDYFSFQGIPYMKPPVGKLRFRDAEPPVKWSEFDATGHCASFVCRDMLTFQVMGQEDAATINVFTKDVKPPKLFPVMVWIHGGGFTSGSSSTDFYGPDYILQKDVILVSFNYRLGALGFLSLKDPTLGVPGNAGLKDQVFALKWVQKNIENFGGDKNNVTLFGESAGGVSVHYHMISEKSEGLFNRAIPMSGVAFNCWALQPNRNYAQRLASLLQYDGDQSDKNILSFLETVDVSKIVKLSHKILSAKEIHGEKMFGFGPCIEPYVSENCFIPKSPLEMARSAWSNEIDCLIGGTSNEGLLMGLDPTKKYPGALALQNINYFTPSFDLGLDPEDPKAAEYGKMIKPIYYGDSTPSKTNLECYFRYIHDLYFWHGIQRAVLLRAGTPTQRRGKTYLYRYDVVTELNVLKKAGSLDEYPGSEHAADIFHLFKAAFTAIPSIDSKEFENIKKIVAIWTNFAITGNPNHSITGNHEEWKAIESSNLPLVCLNIGTDECTIMELPETERLRMWNSVFQQAGVEFIGSKGSKL